MSLADREGLIGRIRQVREVRRLATAREQPGTAESEQPGSGGSDPETERLRALETRLAHLEQMVEGLQDSVHRESERQARGLAELQAQVQPGAMAAALAKEARERGI